MTNMVALNNQKHTHLKVAPNACYLGATEHLVPVVVSEFAKLIVHYPIVLTKFDDSGKFGISALLGFEQQENLFWQQGQWDAIYIPAQIDRLPFYVGSEQQDAEVNHVLCIDLNNNAVNENEGAALFDVTGEPTPYLSEKQQILAQLLDGEKQNQQFIQALQTHNLITPLTLDITFENESKTSISGLYTIDEDKLRQLSSHAIADLQQQELLQPIYTFIASHAHIFALIDKKNKANKQGEAWFARA